MRRRVFPIALLVLGAALTVLNHVRVVARDDGWLLEIDGRTHDVGGALRDRLRTGDRACAAAVEAVPPDAPAWAEALDAARAHSPPDSHTARIVSLQRAGDVYLAELNFARLEPAVVLLSAGSGHSGSKRQILEHAIWSGSTEPWVPGPFIRRYLHARAPEVPGALIDCFRPQSAGFAGDLPMPAAPR